jgi:uncharacterized SAM-binding protein YcdF (DUF218 family)
MEGTGRATEARGAASPVRKFFVRFCVVFTVVLLTLQFSPFVPWLLNRLVGQAWQNPDGDILIVLAADEPPGDLMGPATFLRGVYGVRAWRGGHFRAAVVSGGPPAGGHPSPAAAIAGFLSVNGIPREKIFLEERSTNTRESAVFTKEMIASWPGKRVLVTSDIHIFRALRAFQEAGLPVEPRPFPYLLKYWNSQFYRIPQTMRLLIEMGKIGYYGARGWIRL